MIWLAIITVLSALGFLAMFWDTWRRDKDNP